MGNFTVAVAVLFVRAGPAGQQSPPRDPARQAAPAPKGPEWQQGEVRATHRRAPRPARDWRTRKDPFASAWPCVRAWLEAEPDRVAQELFARLQGELPGVFPDSQLRTFQRRVREWRQVAARQLIFASPSKDAA